MARAKKNQGSGSEEDRQALLERLRAETKLGKQIGFASDEPDEIDVIGTGNLQLDKLITPVVYKITGNGGIPRGKVVEIFGPPSGGKTCLALRTASTVTAKKNKVYWIDAENAWNKFWALAQGVDIDYVVKVGQGECNTGEVFLTNLEKALKSGDFELAVVDSITAIASAVSLRRDATNEKKGRQPGQNAALFSEFGPRLISAAAIGNCSLIVINQIREKVGVFFGNPETTPGGYAFKFYSSLRIRISPMLGKKDRGILKDDVQIGVRSNIDIVKTRFSQPFVSMILPIYFDQNVKPDALDQLIDLGLEHKIIKVRNKTIEDEKVPFFFYGDLKNLEGADELKSKLKPAQIISLSEDVKKVTVLNEEVEEFLKTVAAEPTEKDDELKIE